MALFPVPIVQALVMAVQTPVLVVQALVMEVQTVVFEV
ncbi:hypothetical protein PI125_g3622 [Phytophthora idaei]|nr:hypothetical protein PI125_g3622 [Phytophthora idaei]